MENILIVYVGNFDTMFDYYYLSRLKLLPNHSISHAVA